MSITINAGQNNSVTLDAGGDLAKALTPGLQTILHMSDAIKNLAGIPDATLADVPARTITDAFTTDQVTTWDLSAAANLTLTFKPEVGGTIQFTKPGPLLTYFDADKKTFAIEVPEGSIGVSVSFYVNLNVGGGVQYSAGNVGIRANLTDKDQFLVANHRYFPASMNVFAALRLAFEGFKLPFLTPNVTTLPDNLVLEFDFSGVVNVGCGITYGLTTQLGGRSTSEIAASLSHGLATAALKAAPTLKAGAEFGITYDHEDAFRFVIAPEGSDAITLTIFRRDKSSLGTKESLGITVDPGLSFDLTSKADQMLGAAVDQVCGHLANGAGDAAADKIKAKLRTLSTDAVTKLTTAVNERVNGLLKKTAGTIELQLLQERETTDTALFRLHFDKSLNEEAIQLALQGRIAEAVQQKGVEVDPGSLVEHAFIQRATIGLQLFDLWRWNDVVEYLNKVSIVYAGNGVLRLIGTEGLTHAVGTVGHASVCDMHFLAEATEAVGSGSVGPVNVSLHFLLNDRQQSQTAATARLLVALTDPDLAPTIAAATTELRHGRTALTTTAVFPPSSFAAFQADPYTKGKPGPLPHDRDAHNYAIFADSVRLVDGQFLGFATWEGWATFNRVANDQQNSTMIPDRHNSGNLMEWPNTWASTPSQDRQLRCYHSESARHFMNLVEALQALVATSDINTEEQFTLLLESLNGIVKNDVPVDFIKATLLALIKLAGGRVGQVETSTEGATINVSLRIAG